MSIPQEEIKVNLPTRLTHEFYSRNTLSVARELLGKHLVRILEGHRLSGRIVEVEAYIGEDDKACHASPGPTTRNAPMYGPPGHAYIYLIYGMHYCLNLVTEPAGFPAAVLIRASEPLEGLDVIQRRRGNRAMMRDLARGPGRLCQALGIDFSFNNADLCAADASLWIEDAPALPDVQVSQSPRIGVRGDERALSVPWRYFVSDSPWVSGSRSFNDRHRMTR